MRLFRKWKYATMSHPGWKDSRTVTVREYRLLGFLYWHTVHLTGTRRRSRLRGTAKLRRFGHQRWQKDAIKKGLYP
jgi:hypothetical protein